MLEFFWTNVETEVKPSENPSQTLEQNDQFPSCEKPSEYHIFTEIDNSQITTLDTENENLDEVFQNSGSELDFNSFESEKRDLKFDLPSSDKENLKVTTLNFENDQYNEVVNNSS